MIAIEFSLPWPPASLSPNGQHGAWQASWRARKQYRDACFVSVLADRVPRPTAARLDVLLRFVPPHARRYDRDNLVARCKAGLDGLALAWQIDDARFVRVAAEIVDGPAAGSAAAVRVVVREHEGTSP